MFIFLYSFRGVTGGGGGGLTKETKEVASSSTHVPAARFVSPWSVVTEKLLKNFHTEKSLKSD